MACLSCGVVRGGAAIILLLLIPISLAMGLAGFAAFLWALRNDQFSDLDGAAWRVVLQHEAQRRERKGARDAAAGGTKGTAA